METMLAVLVGIGLSAACGFRVFVPLLVASVAAHSGHLHLAAGCEWLGSTPALVAFAIATALEIGAYYIPWLDHLLDLAATPTAVVAGTLLTASQIQELSPFLRWTLALLVGGGTAGGVQAVTVLTRAASTATTGGWGNPLVSTLEWMLSTLASLAALLVPAGVLIVAAIVVVLLVRARRSHLVRATA